MSSVNWSMNLLAARPASRPELWLAAFVIAVVSSLSARWALLPGNSAAADGVARWGALTPYLSAPQQVTAHERGAPMVSWEDPFDAPRYATISPPAARRGLPRVTAILISQQRRLAIIDDRIVGVGDPVLGGGRVEAIEPEEVILTLEGRREILRLLPQPRAR